MNKLIIGGAGDGAVRSYKSNNGDLVWVCNAHTEQTLCLVVSELWELVVSGSSDGSMVATHIRGGTQEWRTVVFPSQDAILVMEAGEDIWTIFVGGAEGTVAAFSAKDGSALWRLPGDPFDLVGLRVVIPVGVPSFLAKYVFSFVLTEDSQGTLTSRDTKVRAVCVSVRPWWHVGARGVCMVVAVEVHAHTRSWRLYRCCTRAYIQTGRVIWSWEPTIALSTLVRVTAAPRAVPFPGGRASLGGIRSVVSKFQNGSLRVSEVHSGVSKFARARGGSRSTGDGGARAGSEAQPCATDTPLRQALLGTHRSPVVVRLCLCCTPRFRAWQERCCGARVPRVGTQSQRWPPPAWGTGSWYLAPTTETWKLWRKWCVPCTLTARTQTHTLLHTRAIVR